MNLFIANCSQQIQEFAFRLPGTMSPLPRRMSVAIGGQIKLPYDLTAEQISKIIKQHGRYGLVDVKEIDRTKPFVGMCYSVDVPVTVAALQRAIVHNKAVLTEKGKELRKEAAVAASSEAVKSLSDGSDLKGMEVEIIEEKGEQGGEGEINETIRVDSTADPKDERANNRNRQQRRQNRQQRGED